jgi:hypothetical protein
LEKLFNFQCHSRARTFWGGLLYRWRSQLSYTPMCWKTLYSCGFPAFSIVFVFSVVAGGFTGEVRSQLSYTPKCRELLVSKLLQYSVFKNGGA